MYGQIAAKEPMSADLELGKTYFWCACGHSKTQPFCDGAHKEVNKSLGDLPAEEKFKPVRITAEKAEQIWLCMCKHTKTPPYCDGTHKTL